MRIPASSSEKARVAQQYRIFSVYVYKFAMRVLPAPGHSHVIRDLPLLHTVDIIDYAHAIEQQ